MTDIQFIVPGIPAPQPRPRVFRQGPYGSRTVSAMPGDPVHAFKATCRLMASQAYQGPLLDEPVALTLLFVFPRLQNNRSQGRVLYPGKKDIDNVAKATMDALNGVIWRDDVLVCKLIASKLQAAVGEQPHTEVVIWKARD